MATFGARQHRLSRKGKHMKTSLIALTLIALACTACTKKEEAAAAVLPPPASAPSLNTNDSPAPATLPTAPASEATTNAAPAAPASSTENK